MYCEKGTLALALLVMNDYSQPRPGKIELHGNGLGAPSSEEVERRAREIAMIRQFKTLTDLMTAFQDPQAAVDHFTAIRWRNGQFCPHCGHDKVYKLTDDQLAQWKKAVEPRHASWAEAVKLTVELIEAPPGKLCFT